MSQMGDSCLRCMLVVAGCGFLVVNIFNGIEIVVDVDVVMRAFCVVRRSNGNWHWHWPC